MQDVRKAAYLVLHLIIALIQVFVLQTPLILDVNMDVKLSGLSLSQLEHIKLYWYRHSTAQELLYFEQPGSVWILTSSSHSLCRIRLAMSSGVSPASLAVDTNSVIQTFGELCQHIVSKRERWSDLHFSCVTAGFSPPEKTKYSALFVLKTSFKFYVMVETITAPDEGHTSCETCFYSFKPHNNKLEPGWLVIWTWPSSLAPMSKFILKNISRNLIEWHIILKGMKRAVPHTFSFLFFSKMTSNDFTTMS